MRIVVVGAEGLIGRALVRAANAGHTVVGLGRSACDVTNPVARDQALARERPDAVLFCAAMTDVDRAGADSVAVNVDAPAAWASQVETWFLSSNFVMNGPGPHAPGAVPSAINTYAAQKIEAERAVLAAGGHVVRVGWVYGPGGRTFASTVGDRLARGETVRAIFDTVVQPTHADDVAAELLRLPRGVSHLAGAGETSWYGLASAVRAKVGTGTVVPVRTSELGIGPRPGDARLCPATLPPWWDRL